MEKMPYQPDMDRPMNDDAATVTQRLAQRAAGADRQAR